MKKNDKTTLMGTLKGFPNPPAMSSGRLSQPTLYTNLIYLLVLVAGAVSCGSGTASPDGGTPSGTGGSGGGGTGGGNLACDDPNAAIDPTAIIDDMEATDPATVRVGGRTGAWWAGGDPSSVGATIVPNGDAPAEAIPGGRCGSRSAVHVTGQGFSEWAVVSVSMGWGPVDGGASALLPHDAHFRTGVVFWARVGDTSSDQVRFGVSDKYSRPEGGICVEGGAVEVACYDYFGTSLSGLTTTWKRFQIPFGGLSQLGFGLPRSQGLDTTSVYTLEFNLPRTSVFDLWIDDISFY
jgi:hypothetical protein